MSDLRSRFGRNPRRWTWGRVHRLELDPRIRAPSRSGLVLQRTVDQGGRQHRHRPGHLAGARASRSRPGFPRPSWRQVIDVGKWDASGGIHVPGSPGSQDPVTTAISRAAGAPTASSRSTGARRRCAATPERGSSSTPCRRRTRRSPAGEHRGVTTSDQRGIVRGCCLGLIVLLIVVGGSVFLADRALAAPGARRAAGGSVARRQPRRRSRSPSARRWRRSSSRRRTASSC